MTEAEEKAVEKQLAYVAEVSKNARTTWFGLIALMLFCGITLLDVEDKDFFEYGASTQLPLINVSVPTINFFWAAPLLVTGLYTYLHLYLDKLWRALARLGDEKDEIDGRPVTEMVYPWLISDTALEMRPKIKRRPYWLITRSVTFCLCWLVGPIIMALFWRYSWAPHDEWLTSLIGLQLVWLSFVGGSSWIAMHRRAFKTEPERIDGLWIVSTLAFCVALFAVGASGWAKTEDGRWWAPSKEPNPETAHLYSANLYRANFVKPDKDWKGRDAAWRSYQRKHRKDVIAELKRKSSADAPLSAKPFVPSEPKEEAIQARLKKEFEEDRREARAALERRAYRGEDLRNANLQEAVLAGLDLRDARLERADLTRARLERAEMTDAVVQYASVIGTSVSQARNLTQEQINGMYGDGSTNLSNTGLSPPERWPSIPIPRDQRISCWKEWAVSKGAKPDDFPPTNVECTTHADRP